jgi:hypothetical protein
VSLSNKGSNELCLGQPDTTYLLRVVSSYLNMTCLSNGLCHVICLFKWVMLFRKKKKKRGKKKKVVMLELRGLIHLAKQFVLWLTLNELVGQAGQPEPNISI